MRSPGAREREGRHTAARREFKRAVSSWPGGGSEATMLSCPSSCMRASAKGKVRNVERSIARAFWAS